MKLAFFFKLPIFVYIFSSLCESVSAYENVCIAGRRVLGVFRFGAESFCIIGLCLFVPAQSQAYS
jgi:hypothetical protein